PCFAGCKCKKHFQISQAFSNLFFSKISSLLILMPVSISVNVFSLLRVQKYTTIPLKQAFLMSFFILF
ncbi:hypothetical protein, partial [Flavobacterium johnsoniae]|uniref:hypothetical protein n=1 Tax=Flavobacterium johnsoniae TaxID=986 RepID=UPI001C3155A0